MYFLSVKSRNKPGNLDWYKLARFPLWSYEATSATNHERKIYPKYL